MKDNEGFKKLWAPWRMKYIEGVEANNDEGCIFCEKPKQSADEEKNQPKDEVKSRLSIHALRHTFALKTLMESGNIQTVKEILGHSSVTVTEIYTKYPKDYIKQIFKVTRNESKVTSQVKVS